VNGQSDEHCPLRILVGLNRLWLAGAEINAIDLAAKFRQHGHHVVIVGKEEDDRAIVELAEHRGLAVRLLPRGHNLGLIRPLESIVKEERIELIHMYYSRLTVAAFLGPYRRWGIPVVRTEYGPGSFRAFYSSHLIVLTEECAEGMRPWFDAPVSVIGPPVDTDHDRLDAVDIDAFLTCHNIDVRGPRVAVVSRLDRDKLEGVLRTIDACAALESFGVTLVIVGSGHAFSEVRRAADRVNDRLRRQAVVLTGRLLDPRAAYAAADIVIGEGGSALRGLAFEKPVVTLGANGFALPFEPATAEYFFWHGFYGRGPMYDLTAALRRILCDPAFRVSLGQFGRRTVESKYSVDVAYRHLEQIYRAAVHGRPDSSDRWLNTARVLAHYKLPDKLRRFRSTEKPVFY
jgi:glycosyltransferase involved in cell wall biosynthesis